FAQLSYRVRAWNLAGYSDFTETVSAIPRHVIIRSTVSAVETIGKSALVTVPVPAIFFSSFSCGTSTRLQVYLIRLSAEEVVAIGANCTHACCVINYNENGSDPAAGGFTCPCHGSQYRMDGSVKRGPAGNPVAVVQVVTFEDRFELIADHTIPQA